MRSTPNMATSARSPSRPIFPARTTFRTWSTRPAQAFGRIDVLVCNAASNPYYGPMAGISDDQFRKILDNNVIANHWLISMVAPEMLERGEGSIIIVSSIGGLTSSTMIGAYNISKAADFQLARNLAAEFGPEGRAGQLHRAGPGEDRFRPGAVGKSRHAEGGDARRRRCAASASRTRLPARRSISPRRRRPS